MSPAESNLFVMCRAFLLMIALLRSLLIAFAITASCLAQEESDSTATPQAEPQTADDFYSRALEDEKNNDLKAAIADCTAAIELDPENIEFLAARAEFLGETRQFDESFADSAKVLELDGNNARAHLVRARSYEIQGAYDKALSELTSCIERNPESVEAYIARRDFYARQGRHDEAIADSDRVIQLEPDSARGYLARAEVHSLFGESDQAIQYASRALENNPESWLAYQMRGINHGFRHEFDEALKDLDEGVRLAPDRPLIYAGRSDVYDEMGEFGKALADMRHARELEPNNYGYAAGLAEILSHCPDEDLRDPQQASQLIKEALRSSPNQPQLWGVAAAVAADNGDFEEAVRWEEKFLHSDIVPLQERKRGEGRLALYQKREPYRYDPVRRHTAAAIRFKKEGNYQAAVAELEKVAEAKPQYSRIYNSLAWMLATCPDDKVRSGDKASEYIDRALELDPNEIESWDTCAAVFAECGDYDDAVVWEQAYLDRNETSPEQQQQARLRLDLYKAHRPYYEKPDQAALLRPATSEATPAQPEK